MSEKNDGPTEVEVLKAQLQTMRDNDKRVLETVRTCAGLLTVMAALLVGYGWFHNKVNYDRERAALEHEVARETEKKVGVLQEEARRQFERLQTEIRASVAQQSINAREDSGKLRADLLKQVESEVQLSKKRSDLDIELLKLELGTKHQQLAQSLASLSSKSQAGVFFQQGIRLLTNKSFASAADSLLVAALNYEAVGDEVNLQKCIKLLRDACLPALTKTDLETEPDIAAQSQELISRLAKKYVGGRYDEDVKSLKAQLDAATKRVK